MPMLTRLHIGEAGLPDRCVTHRLRKAASRLLAEAGCSANEIAAITGHTTLNEVARYTKTAEQRHLARKAIGRLKGWNSVAWHGLLPRQAARILSISLGRLYRWSCLGCSVCYSTSLS